MSIIRDYLSVWFNFKLTNTENTDIGTDVRKIISEDSSVVISYSFKHLSIPEKGSHESIDALADIIITIWFHDMFVKN